MEDSRSTPQQPEASQSRVAAPAARERRKPRVPEPPPPAPASAQLAEYEAIIGESRPDELRFLASVLSGKTVKMVNSTAVGGGVAEMLNRLVPLLEELEIETG